MTLVCLVPQTKKLVLHIPNPTVKLKVKIYQSLLSLCGPSPQEKEEANNGKIKRYGIEG